ncbi:hypothetical protein V499_08419 [Pseudogymnoascus sp. VKM F-103]|nr:hypothetical protein V499_08419 [Pseudogymnoascus sp. VKM F-103]
MLHVSTLNRTGSPLGSGVYNEGNLLGKYRNQILSTEKSNAKPKGMHSRDFNNSSTASSARLCLQTRLTVRTKSCLSPLVKAERGGFIPICDVIRCFYETCGHIETKTSCHNYMCNIMKQPDRGINPPWIPCNRDVCDQSVIVTRCMPGSCVQCETQDDPTDPLRINFDADPTITRSDFNRNTIPSKEIERRILDYRKRAADTQTRHRELSLRYDPNNLLYSDFSTKRFDRTARDFIEHYRQLRRHPSVVDPEQFYAEVRKQRAEEDKKGIKVEHRQYFSGGKFDETDLLCRLDPTDTRLAKEQCLICQDGFVPEARDPRMMPCEHIFHWACISQWYYRTSRTCPYCRRGYQVMTLPRFLPPP